RVRHHSLPNAPCPAQPAPQSRRPPDSVRGNRRQMKRPAMQPPQARWSHLPLLLHLDRINRSISIDSWSSCAIAPPTLSPDSSVHSWLSLEKDNGWCTNRLRL